MIRFGYQAEKMLVARRALMLPHPSGEAAGLVAAFGECVHALHHLDREQIDDTVAQRALEAIDRTLTVDGLDDPTGRGLHWVKAEGMDDRAKREFADAVDDLATYFDRESHQLSPAPPR